MNYFKKSKNQLIEELGHLHHRIQELEISLKVYEEESIRRREILETSYDYLQAIIDNIGDPILVIDREYHIVLANKKVREIAGGIDPVKARLFCYQVSHHREMPCNRKDELCPLKEILRTKSPVRVTHTHYDSAGNKMLVEIVASPILDKTGGVIHMIASSRDITERKKAEKERNRLIKELKHISQIDGLTGLLNRQHLNKRLTEEIHRTKRYGTPLSLIMFDIDNFKKINDTYGHLTGDKILQKTATTIKEILRDTDIAGRFGGDEFILILVQTNIDTGMQVAERLRAKIEQVQVLLKKEQSISFTISLGICQYNNKVKSTEEFIAKVDRALYMAKYNGYNQICKVED